jgi:hypothetical protein
MKKSPIKCSACGEKISAKWLAAGACCVTLEYWDGRKKRTFTCAACREKQRVKTEQEQLQAQEDKECLISI